MAVIPHGPLAPFLAQNITVAETPGTDKARQGLAVVPLGAGDGIGAMPEST